MYVSASKTVLQTLNRTQNVANASFLVRLKSVLKVNLACGAVLLCREQTWGTVLCDVDENGLGLYTVCLDYIIPLNNAFFPLHRG